MARLRDDPVESLSPDTRTVTATAAALFLYENPEQAWARWQVTRVAINPTAFRRRDPPRVRQVVLTR